MSKAKIALYVEESDLEMLKCKLGTENTSEAVRLAIVRCLNQSKGSELKTLFPYIGKKPPKIGREVAEAFKQSGCDVFVDLFCGSAAMLSYLPWETHVVMNDADGNLTNLYMVIQKHLSEFVSEISKLAYSEVLFQQFKEDIKTGKKMSDMERAVSYYYLRFCAFRGNIKNPEFRISKEQNFAELYQENVERVMALAERLKTVTILNRDFRKVLKNYNSSNVFVYADPPYIETEYYYDVEFCWQDHVALAEMLKAHKGKFALSCKAKREVRKLYRSNRHFCLDFEVSNREKNMRNNEKLIFNFKYEHKNKNGVSNLKPFS